MELETYTNKVLLALCVICFLYEDVSWMERMDSWEAVKIKLLFLILKSQRKNSLTFVAVLCY